MGNSTDFKVSYSGCEPFHQFFTELSKRRTSRRAGCSLDPKVIDCKLTGKHGGHVAERSR